MRIVISWAIILVSSISLTFGQQTDIHERLKSLNIQSTFPENLLKTRSIVFYQVTPKRIKPLVRGNWRSLAEEIQPGLKRAGIDGVLHYYLNDIYSGQESYNSFLDYFDERDVKNAVFVFEEGGSYTITVTDLQDRQHLLKMGQSAWQIRGEDLGAMLSNLYKACANSGLERRNWLILEVPEFGKMINPIKAKRNEFYDLNFSSEKLAVPTVMDTSELRRVLADYPYKWGFVDPTTPEKELRTDGYQYILYSTHSTGEAVKKILDYKTTDVETSYISEVKVDGNSEVQSYSIHTPVYKYYIKHIYSGNVFLGKRWDTAPDWQQALGNYIQNLRNELVK